MRSGMRIMFIVVTLVSLAAITAAQNQPLKFEVATVKPSPPQRGDVQASLGLCHGTDSVMPTFPTEARIALPALGRCLITNMTLRGIVSIANPSVAPTLPVTDRVTGGPAWAASDDFNIEGKAANVESSTNAQLIAMLRQLLADRFKLQFHTEAKEVNGFALVVAKSGAKLKSGSGDFDGFHFGGGIMPATNASMTAFARSLSTRVRAPVVDQTGLKGGYAFNLSIPPDNDPTAPAIFTMLQEELGLRLESTKLAVDIIVIDQAEKPDAN
jgi:uncharacterized protein (TIGR03435 family)